MTQSEAVIAVVHWTTVQLDFEAHNLDNDIAALSSSIPHRQTNHVQTPAEITASIPAAVTALTALPNEPVTLKSAIVLTEAEYNEGWDVDDPDQVVFVLPNRARATGNLLETAKMLMACVPNGI